MIIKILDPVECLAITSPEESKWVRDCLSYKAVYFKRSQYGGKRTTYRKSFLDRKGYFPFGFMNRLKDAAKRDGYVIRIEGEQNALTMQPTLPEIPGIELRPDQQRLTKSAVRAQRGTIISPTGSGKTIIIMALLSCFPSAKALILTHSKSINAQTISELRKHGFDASPLEKKQDQITVTTRQALVERMKSTNKSRVKPEHYQWLQKIEIVIIDECHLFGEMDGQYSKILQSTLASVRIGFTATMPKAENIRMTLEAMIGPMIDQVTYKEGRELSILADVQMQFLALPYNPSIEVKSNYPKAVAQGIVDNRARNRLIVMKAKELVEDGMTVLIFIERLEHGRNLERVARLVDLPALFIEGSTKSDVREEIKKAFTNKHIRCVISSKVWREGINIPNLGAVILAGGGKAELSTLQAIGRGLRKAEGKERAIIVDVLDPYHYLAEHAIQRLSLYTKQGWI